MKKLEYFNVLFTVIILSFLIFISCHNANEFTSKAIATVPSSFPVKFALYTVGEDQFVAFYDDTHQMVIGKRNVHSDQWSYQPLNSKIEWDSHNYISMEIDPKGFIHVVGNMHSSPLLYFRSKVPYDIHSMQEIHYMFGKDEDITTYPEFIKGPNGELIFHYRYGISGSGYEIYNRWNSDNQSWSRLLEKPLIDGEQKMNAYMQGPLLGPDNNYHLLWVWRDTPDCATNHTLSYARSKDLLNWESIQGEKIELPITFMDTSTYIDKTPIYGGLINIGIKIGFDPSGNVLAGYHKYDIDGNTQLFIARFENNLWKSKQVSDWDYRWDFKGYGTIKNELLIESPKPSTIENEIIFGYHHTKYGNGQLIIDNKTLQPIRTENFETSYPKNIDVLQSANSNMIVHKVFDKGIPTTSKKYLLRWETLPPNNDKAITENNLNTALELIEYQPYEIK